MTDDSRPESSDDRPGQSSDDGPAAQPDRKTPDRAPTVRIDLSHLEPLAEVGRQIGEQLAETIKIGVRARLDRVTASTAGPPPWLVDFQRSLRERMPQTVPIPTPQYDFGPALGRILAESRPHLVKLQRLLEDLKQLIPENLRELRAHDHADIFRISAEDGTSLAWAPRVSIVRELLEADDLKARGAVLVSRAVEIANDVEASLTAVVLPEHQALRALLLEAAAAVRSGLYGPAQAAACNAFDTIVNVRIFEFLAYEGRDSKTRTRKHFRPVDDWGEVTFAELELVLVGGGIATAFEWWSRGTGHTSFNRNGSVHHVDDGAYSPAHAIRALLIAQAALRWLDAAVSAAPAAEDAA